MDENKILKEIEDSRIAVMTVLEDIKDKIDKHNFELEAFKHYVREKLG